VGRGALLEDLTKRLLERGLEGELTEHLGYESTRPRPQRRQLARRPFDEAREHGRRRGEDRGATRP
jgi:transposase-like protein